MENQMWFKQQYVRDREEYEAMADYFLDSAWEKLDCLTTKEWTAIIEQLWDVLFSEEGIDI
jgi:hypothetical protein